MPSTIDTTVQKLFILCGGFPADTVLAPQLAQMFIANNTGAINAVLNDYLGGQAAALGAAGLVSKMALQGLGVNLSAAQAADVASQVTSGQLTWAGLALYVVQSYAGPGAETLANRATVGQALTDALLAQGKGAFYGGANILGDASGLLAGVTDASTTVTQGVATMQELVAKLGSGGLTGKIADGYLTGATVFVDANANGVLDAGEYQAASGGSGSFVIAGNAPRGDLAGFGGTDIMTGQAFQGVVRAPAGATVLNPLTTLAEGLLLGGSAGSAQQAANMVRDALGLPATINLLNYDPIAALIAGANVSQALAVQQVLFEVGNVITLASVSLDAATPLTLAQSANLIIDSMADALAAGTLNLTSAASLSAVIVDAVADYIGFAPPPAVIGVIDQLAGVIAGINQAAADADNSHELAQVATVAEGSAAQGLVAAFGGTANLGATFAQFSGANLDAAIDAATVGSLAPGIPVPTPVLLAPTLGAFSGALETTAEDTQVEITLAELLAQGNESDADGSVTGFVVKAVSSGSLLIGTSAGTATAWSAGTNDLVDATRKAYWTPAANANGTLDAFTAVARDDDGLVSSPAVQVTVISTPVNDAPTLSAFASVLDTIAQGTQVEITRDELLAYGNEADVDGTVTAFVITAVTSGTLTIGSSALSSTPWVAGTNDVVDGTHHLYWTSAGGASGTINAFTAVARDNSGAVSAAPVQASIAVTLPNVSPTLTSFAAPLKTTAEDVQVEITLADLKSQGNEADPDGTVVAFVVKASTSGTLRIGTSELTATFWAVGTNDVIDATHQAYWTPPSNGNGTLDAFTLVARDNVGANSATPVQAQVVVTPVNDEAKLTAFSGVLDTTREDTQVEITLAEFKAKGNEVDFDGTINAFVIKSVTSGTLKIGATAGTATAWAPGTNDRVDDAFNAYWTRSPDTVGTIGAFTVVAMSTDGTQSAPPVPAQILVTATPTLTQFASYVDTTTENAQVEVTFADLAAQGDENDADGTVDAFVLKAVSSGTLLIGASAATATPWAAGTNDTLDATTNAYWTPALNANGVLDAFTAVAVDNEGTESIAAVQAQVRVKAAPTLSSFAGPLDFGPKDTQVEITLAEILAQGDEADVDGTVDAFVVAAVSTGTLLIGASAGTATAWQAGVNDIVDATHNAYWSPVNNASGLQDAFTLVAKDNEGLLSASPVQAQVQVNSRPVLDASPVLSLSIAETVGNSLTPAAPTGAVGVLVSSFLGGASDADPGSILGMAVTAFNSSGSGQLWYSINGGANWTQLTAASDSSAVLLAGDSRIIFKPNALVAGTLDPVFTFKAWDMTSGSTGNTGVDTTTDTAYSLVSDTVAATLSSSATSATLASAGTIYYGGSGVDTVTITGPAGSYSVQGSAADDVVIYNGSAAAYTGALQLGTGSSNIVRISVSGTNIAGTTIASTGGSWQLELGAGATLGATVSSAQLAGASAASAVTGAAGTGNTLTVDTSGGGLGTAIASYTLAPLVENWSIGTTTASNFIALGATGQSVTLGAGNDVISSGTFSGSMSGGAGNDSITGGAANDTIAGGADNDTLAGAGGNDNLTGGTGADTFNVSGGGTDAITDFGNGADVLAGTLAAGSQLNVTLASGGVGFSAATIAATNGVVSVTGGTGNDTIAGGAGNDTTTGAAGDDTFDVSGGGTDTLTDFGNGSDVLSGALAAGGQLNVTLAAGGVSFSAATIAATNGVVSVTGGAGNDTIAGGAGNDTVTGAGGDDTFDVSGGGNDTITDFGNGADALASTLATGGQLNVTLASGGVAFTAATIAATNGVVSVTGGSGDDAITGGAGNDTLAGAGGNDALTGGTGADTFVVGGAGTDSIADFGDGADVLSGTLASGAQLDVTLASGGVSFSAATIAATNGVVSVSGGAGNDSITGGAGNDTLAGAGGDDSLTGGTGADTFDVGGGGTDTITDFGTGADVLANTLATGGQLNVTLVSGGVSFSAAAIAATDGVVSVSGGSGNDSITGGANNDTLAGAGGNDNLTGGMGDDTFDVGGGGTDTIADFGAGADVLANTLASGGQLNVTLASGGVSFSAATIAATNGVVSVSGGSGNDTITGGAGNDTLAGAAGNDSLTGGTGADTFDVGGGGTDTISDFGDGADVLTGTLGAGDQFNITLANGGVSFSAATIAATSGVVSVTGGTGNDSITGGANADTLLGGAGNDVLSGGGGNDSLAGGADDDALTGGTGVDSFDVSGGGTDTITDFGDGADVLAGTMASGGILNATLLTSSNVTFDASTAAATNGVVSVTGGGGNDIITGGAGIDTLLGGAGNDSLIGGGGNDSLNAGAGNDTMTGGAGADTFNVGGGSSGDVDSITDFGSGADVLAGTMAASTTLNVQLVNGGVTIDVSPVATAATTATSVTGGTGADNITGGTGNDTLAGVAGNDTLTGGAGDDTFNVSGGGNDSITDFGSGADALAGPMAANTTLSVQLVNGGVTISVAGVANAATTATSVTGGTGNDSMTGGTGNDTLAGAAGNDTLTGGAGNDTFNVGGGGNDSITDFGNGDALAGPMAASTTLNVQLVNGGVTISVAGVANAATTATSVTGGTGNDSMTGGTGNDTLAGAAGNDTLTGGAGDDTFDVGGGGNDSITDFGSGTDVLAGTMAASTTLSVQLAGGGITFSAVPVATASTTAVSVTGGAGADNITGGAGNDTLAGAAGNDTLTGGAGNDTFNVGGGGNDAITDFSNGDALAGPMAASTTLNVQLVNGGVTISVAGVANAATTATSVTGGTGNDSMTGGTGNDTLAGAAGNDTLTGGAGNDTFNVGGGGNDSITDFGNGDVLAGPMAASTTLNVQLVNGGVTISVAGVATAATTATSVTGGTGNDSMTGGTGNDTLAGVAGNDTLTGGAGDDTFDVGGGGNDSITDFGSGTDVLAGTMAASTTLSVQLAGGGITFSAVPVATASTTAVSVTGGAGADNITGGAGNDTLAGAAGNDTLTGGAGNDTFNVGGGGNDSITDFGNGDVLAGPMAASTTLNVQLVNGGVTISVAGVATAATTATSVTGGTGNDSMTGGTGNDTLAGAAGNDTLTGGAGDDTFDVGGGGNDSITDFGSGTDVLAGTMAASTTLSVQLAGGGITFSAVPVATASTTAVSVTGGAGADNITGGAGNDTLAGAAGNDTLTGGAGNDTFNVGGGGNDAITDFSNGDALAGPMAASTTLNVQLVNGGVTISVAGVANAATTATSVTGGTGNDSMTGGTGNDTLAGAAGNDTLTGGAGNDTFNVGGGGNDSITDFGNGDVLAGPMAASTTLNVQLVNGGVTISVAGVATAATTATSVTGGTGNDSMTGGTGNDTLAGAAGNDTLTGGAGDDTFNVSGGGNDAITDFSNGDVLAGPMAAGTTLSVQLVNGGVAISVAGVANAATTATSVTGGTGNDSITGGTGNDTLNGGTGNDVFDISSTGTDAIGDFGDGADSLTSVLGAGIQLNVNLFSGNDVTFSAASIAATNGVVSVTGGNGNDSITGGANNDTLNGGAGNDTISGGAGNDTISGGGGTNVLSGNAGSDSFVLANGVDIISDYGAGDSVSGTTSGSVNVTFVDGANSSINLTGLLTGTATSKITGGDGNDTIVGSALIDTITGGLGNDSIDAGAGNDTINLSAGTDTVTGGAGDDSFNMGTLTTLSGTLDGGTNTDTLNITTSGGNLTGATISNFEAVTLGSGVSATMQLALANVISTATGVNTVTVASSGAVTGNAAVENYVLFSGNDTFSLTAFAADGVLRTLNLGGGADTVVLTNAAYNDGNSNSYETITGFTAGAGGDIFQLRGVQAFTGGYLTQTVAGGASPADGTVVEISTGTYSGSFTDMTAAKAFIVAAFAPGTNNRDYAVIVYNAAGDAAIYEGVANNANTFASLELIGVVSTVGTNAFVAANFT